MQHFNFTQQLRARRGEQDDGVAGGDAAGETSPVSAPVVNAPAHPGGKVGPRGPVRGPVRGPGPGPQRMGGMPRRPPMPMPMPMPMQMQMPPMPAPGMRGGGGRRVFGQGGLRFVLLRLIAEKPSHGYELIKAIEDALGGSYAPSPGVVYPTLTMLEDLGYLHMEAADDGGRKRYSITDSGKEFLEANKDVAETMMARMNGGADGAGPRAGRSPQVMRALENFKLAIRMRLSRGPLTEEQAQAIAAVLDNAAQQLDRT